MSAAKKQEFVTVVNNRTGVQQYIHCTPQEGRGLIKPRNTKVIVLYPGANAQICASTWASLEGQKDGPVAKDIDSGQIATMGVSIDKLPKRELVQAIRGLTHLDTARYWASNTTRPDIKKALEEKIKSMVNYEEDDEDNTVELMKGA